MVFMDIKIPVKLLKQYKDASFWEHLFLLNYYDNKTKLRPKENKYETINRDVKEELTRLYSLADDASHFELSSEKNKFLEKIYSTELEILSANGEKEMLSNIKKNKKRYINQLADKYSSVLYEQYKSIVNVIKNSNYPDVFKCLMLNETLSKVYKLDDKDVFMSNRDAGKTTAEHMILNEVVLEYIYNNISSCDSFSKLYLDAVLNYRNTALKGNDVAIEGLNTFNKGKWIKFNGKKNSTDKEFHDNVSALKTLVSSTIWCTKNEASEHLTFGDFYVFVDNENKPHIAVKMNGRTLEEVRGILPGQRIEDDYNDVVNEFLTKNKEIPNGKEWINNQKWYEVLKRYIVGIESGSVLSIDQLEEFKKNVFDYKEYRPHGGESAHYTRLIELIIKNNYIVDYLKKSSINDNKKLSNVIKCADIVSKIKEAKKYEELEKVLVYYYGSEECELIREDGVYRDLIMKALKEDKPIELLSSRIDKNGKLFEKFILKNTNNYSVKYNMVSLINSAYIYKNIDTVKDAFELEKYIDFLYQKESLDEYKIDRLILGEDIRDKLHSKHVISLLSKKVEENNGVLLNNDIGKNEVLIDMINEAYLCLHFNEIDSIEKLEPVLAFLYDTCGSFGAYHKYKIDDLSFKEEINKWLESKKIKEIITTSFKCNIDDVLFADEVVKSNEKKYDNKIVYGRVLLGGGKNIEFPARGVLGVIARERAFDESSNKSSVISFPNLIYCGNMVLENADVLNFDQLVKSNKLSLRNIGKLNASKLRYSNYIGFTNIKDIEVNSLERTGSLFVKGSNKLSANLLETSSNVEIKDCNEVDCSSLLEVNGSLVFENVKNLKCGSLECVGETAAFKKCNIDSLARLNSVGKSFSLEQSMCEIMPKSKAVQKKNLNDKNWVLKFINKMKNKK